MHEGMNPSQKRVEVYAAKGLSWGSGRPAGIPTIGRVGRVRHLVSPTPPFLLSSLLLPLLFPLACFSHLSAWVDQPGRKGMAFSLKSGWRGVLGLESLSS